LALDPLEKCCFVDQNPTASTLNYAIKAICFGKKNQVTESTLGWPFMVVIPFRNWDKTGMFSGGKVLL
jgi:hypothetical protein